MLASSVHARYIRAPAQHLIMENAISTVDDPHIDDISVDGPSDISVRCVRASHTTERRAKYGVNFHYSLSKGRNVSSTFPCHDALHRAGEVPNKDRGGVRNTTNWHRLRDHNRRHETAQNLDSAPSTPLDASKPSLLAA